MTNDHTINLLRECSAGAKMAARSIDEVMGKVKDESLAKTLAASRENHEKLGDETRKELEARGSKTAEPALMAKGMSWMKTNMTLAVGADDAAIADLITDGCTMGIKSLSRYVNKNPEAEHKAKSLANSLVGLEEKLAHDLRAYL
ncbi:MAG: hypothetical protein E7223_04300 [Clostridiales bacterium]|nr:hypothetical protein [Clostridiales bacterium]MBQ3107302.1 hypothetical protein [Bacillota bacterium]